MIDILKKESWWTTLIQLVHGWTRIVVQVKCFKILLTSELTWGDSLGILRWLSGKEPACPYRSCRRCGFDGWVRKIPWRRNGYPLQYSCQENSKNRGTKGTTVHGVTKSQIWPNTQKKYMIKPNLLRKHYFCSLHVSAETFSKGVDAIFWWPVFWMKARSASLPLLGPALGSCSQLGRGWEGKCWAEGLAQLLLQLQILNAAVSHQCASALLNCHL